MRINRLKPCPFCGAKPVRNDDIGPTGFAWSNEEEQIFHVACMTKGCPPSGVYLPDIAWNIDSTTQEGLMENIFATMKAEESPLHDERQEFYKEYLKR